MLDRAHQPRERNRQQAARLTRLLRGGWLRAGFMRRLPVPTFGRWTPVITGAGSLLAVLGCSLLTGIVLRALVVSDALNPFREETGLAADPLQATPNPAFLGETVLEGGEDQRVTVVLLGADTRPSEAGYRTPTDTIMLLSIDREARTAGILSLPRDLYVDIPGYGPNRINTAYVRGGGELVKQTVEYNLGVHADYFVLVQFQAFVTLVDEIGGIDIYVPQEIYDPEFPAECYSRSDCGFDPLYIPAGQQHMDGLTALKYARVRHTDTDYDRARRQQAVLFAIRDRVVSLDALPRLVQRAPTLHATLSESIRTDMTLEQMVELAQFVGEIPRENIRSDVVDSDYVSNYVTEEGSQVLMPDRERIDELIKQVFWVAEEPGAAATMP